VEPTSSLEALEERLAALEGEVSELKERLVGIEAAVPEAGELEATDASPKEDGVEDGVEPDVEPDVEPGVELDDAAPRGARVGTLAGRTCLVFGGAFFLRSLTEAGTTSAELGVLLGLVYAFFWLAAAARASAAGHPLSATFHGVSAALLAFPLMFEAAVGFAVLTASTSAILMLAFGAVALVSAYRWRLRATAWAVLWLGFGFGVYGFFATEARLLFALELMLVCAGAMLVGRRGRWPGLTWSAGAQADFFVLLLTVAAALGSPGGPPEVLLALQFVLLGSFVAVLSVTRPLRLEHVPMFDAAQAAPALGLGLGGAALLSAGVGPIWLMPFVGFLTAAFGLRWALTGRSQQSLGTRAVYATMGAVGLTVGFAEALPPLFAGLVLASIALAAVWLRAGSSTPAIRGQAGLLIIAAGIITGMPLGVLDALSGPAESLARAPELGAIGTTLLAGLVWLSLLRLRRADERMTAWVELAGFGVLAAGVGWMMLHGLSGPLAGRGGESVDLGALATLRTGVLAAAAIGAGVASFKPRLRRLRNVTTAVLPIMLLKALLEDFRTGQTGWLFVSLLLLGVTLIVWASTQRLDRAGG